MSFFAKIRRLPAVVMLGAVLALPLAAQAQEAALPPGAIPQELANADVKLRLRVVETFASVPPDGPQKFPIQVADAEGKPVDRKLVVPTLMFPRAARNQQTGGTAIVHMTMEPAGAREYRLASSSGKPVLDAAAQSVAQGITLIEGPLNQPLTVLLTVEYVPESRP